MKFKSIFLILTAAALAVLPSCKKDEEETETNPYLNGTLSFEMPLFVNTGEEFTLVPKGATNPTTGKIGYYWYASWTGVRDTVKTETGSGDGSWIITMPDETGSYTITATAYASDYSSLTASHTFTVVDSAIEGSLKGAGYQIDSVKFVDPRDGGTYYLASSGGKVWMQNNLYYSGSGVSYEYSSAMDPVVGRMYNWSEAHEACPEGWCLPSDSDFAALAGIAAESVGETFYNVAGTLMADVTFNGSKMWTFWPEVKITNSAKFSAIPIGYAIDQEERQRYTGTNSYAVFWTSDNDEDSALYRYIYVDKNSIFASTGDKESFRASVRCVKEEEAD